MTKRDLRELRGQALEDGPLGRIARAMLKLHRAADAKAKTVEAVQPKRKAKKAAQ